MSRPGENDSSNTVEYTGPFSSSSQKRAMQFMSILRCTIPQGTHEQPLVRDTRWDQFLNSYNESCRQEHEEASLRCFENQSEIHSLPMLDVVWSLMDILPVEMENGESLRIMYLKDLKAANSLPIQINIADSAKISLEEQALQLVCHGCLAPLTKCPRRPRIIHFSDTHGDPDIQLDTQKFGIKYFRPATSKKTVHRYRKDNTDCFKQCASCRIRATRNFFIICTSCSAVLYCSKECERKDFDENHKDWCHMFSKLVKHNDFLADLPFSYIKETTSETFDEEKLEMFLKRNDVFHKHLWRKVCHLSSALRKHKFIDMFHGLLPLGLPLEDTEMECPAQTFVDIRKPLTDWMGYYRHRGFWMDSLAACILHYSLTLYYIFTSIFPQQFPAEFERIMSSKKLTIHLVGVESEVEMFNIFLEFARLVAPLQVTLLLVGKSLPRELHGQKLPKKENLSMTVSRGLYHQTDPFSLGKPDVVVCLNAGISAYTSYIPTIQFLFENNIPVYCSDYCQASLCHAGLMLRKHKTGFVQRPVLNPFRSPVRMVATDDYLPRYSNAYITRLIPYNAFMDKSDSKFFDATFFENHVEPQNEAMSSVSSESSSTDEASFFGRHLNNYHIPAMDFVAGAVPLCQDWMRIPARICFDPNP